jgi:hypothetical protein
MARWRPTDDPDVTYQVVRPGEARHAEVLLRRRLDGGGTATFTYAIRGRRLVLTDLAISSEAASAAAITRVEPPLFTFSLGGAEKREPIPTGEHEISSRDLRSLTIDEEKRIATSVARTHKLLDKDGLALPKDVRVVAANIRPKFADLRGGLVRAPGPRGHRDEYYALVALAYVICINDGSEQPVQDAAALLDADPAHIRDCLHRARRRGLLEEVPRGHAGGGLTEKGLDALRKLATDRDLS